MSELKEAAAKELFSKCSAHSLAHLTSGVREIAVIDKRVRKETLTKYLKDRWILEEDFNENYDMIVQWDQTREAINDLRREIRELEEDVTSMRDQITSIERGKWKSLRPMLPRYREILDRDLETLPAKKQQLEEAKIEFKPLKAQIKSLRDKFKLYISQLEVRA